MGPPREHIWLFERRVVEISCLILEDVREGARNPVRVFICVSHPITKLWRFYQRLAREHGISGGCIGIAIWRTRLICLR